MFCMLCRPTENLKDDGSQNRKKGINIVPQYLSLTKNKALVTDKLVCEWLFHVKRPNSLLYRSLMKEENSKQLHSKSEY